MKFSKSFFTLFLFSASLGLCGNYLCSYLSYAGILSDQAHQAKTSQEAHQQNKSSEWSYAGQRGYKHWSEINSDYKQCSTGHRQSPINIYEVKSVPSKKLSFHYHPFHEVIMNNGHTVELLADENNEIVFEDKHYNLIQMHFHTPSEHVFWGKHYPLEMHMVHSSKEGKLLVIALVFEKGAESPLIKSFIEDVPEYEGIKDIDKFIDFRDLLSKKNINGKTAYLYEGSLTTPPCSERVTWLLLKKPFTASNYQISKIRSIEGMNSRPSQKHYDRKVQSFKLNYQDFVDNSTSISGSASGVTPTQELLSSKHKTAQHQELK